MINRSKGSHTDNVLENVFFGTRRGLNCRLVVFLGCKPSTNYTKFEIPCGQKKIVFLYCVRFFEYFCGGRKIVLLYGDSVRSYSKDIIFACKKKVSGGQ